MTNISLHFTLKDQNINDLIVKFQESPMGKYLADKTVLVHNCFLTKEEVVEKGFPTVIHDFIASIGGDFNWSKNGKDLRGSRVIMLEHLRDVSGTAIFIGEIKDGVQEEYDLAWKLNLNVARIA